MEFRFGDHDAFGDNFNSNSDLNISIYVAYYYYSNRGFSKTPYSEWVSDPDVFESNPKSVIDAMALSIKNVIINGVFQMDNSVASKVDTAKPDSLADIVKMYCENNNKKIIFTFIDFTKKRYNFTVDDISDYNKQSLSINITANQQQSVLLVDNEGKCSVNGNFIAPTRDISDKWKNFIECVRNWINKSIKESKQNMKNVQQINESQLRAIVTESVKKVLNENIVGSKTEEHYNRIIQECEGVREGYYQMIRCLANIVRFTNEYPIEQYDWDRYLYHNNSVSRKIADNLKQQLEKEKRTIEDGISTIIDDYKSKINK